MDKIIAFSLWGDNPKYTIGALKNADLARQIYPEWQCVFYTANDVPNNICVNLMSLGAKVIDMGAGDWTSMFWRFTAADSDDIVLSRDTDSRLSIREKEAVDEWLSSDKDFHIMRDHPCHAVPIMGGMWGARNGILKGITKDINNYSKGNFWQVDQNFLKTVVYPKVSSRAFVHDPYYSNSPFPSERNGTQDSDHIGKAFNADDTPCS